MGLPSSPDSKGWLPLAPVWVAAATGGVALLHFGRSLWFFGDEWDFLLHREAGSIDDLLRPHNEHLSVLPILIFRGLVAVFSTTSYMPFTAALAITHAAIAIGIGMFLLRQGAPALLAALITFGVMTFGPGGANLLWAFQIGFMLSLISGLAAFSLLDRGRLMNDRRGDVLAGAALVVSLLSSGVGVTMLAAAAIDLFLRRHWRRLAVVCAVPFGLIVAWILTFGQPAGDSATRDIGPTLLHLPAYVARGLTRTLDGVLGVSQPIGFLGVLLLGLALFVWAAARVAPIPHMTSAPLLAILVLFVGAGVTRAAELGVAQAGSSRYIHIGGLLLLTGAGGAFLASTAWRRHRSTSTTWIAALVVGLSVGANLMTLGDLAVRRASLTMAAREGVEALAILVSEPGNPYLGAVAPVESNPYVDVDTLAEALASGSFELAPGFERRVSATALTRFRALTSIALRTALPAPNPLPVVVLDLRDLLLESADGGCVVLAPDGSRPFVVFAAGAGGWVSINTSVAGDVRVFAVPGGVFEREHSVTSAMSAGSPLWIETAEGLPSFRVDPPPNATITACGS